MRVLATEQEHWFEFDHLEGFLKGSVDVRHHALSGAAKLFDLLKKTSSVFRGGYIARCNAR